MEMSEALDLGVRYMNEHNLRGWKFEVNDMTRYYGLCNYQEKTIYLSSYAIFFKTHEEVVDIIKHEIAHALVGQGHHHDKVWKRKCIEIGGNGKRCGSFAFIKKYEVKCDWCGRRYRSANRKKKYGECECGPLGVIQHTPTKEFEEYEAWLKNNTRGSV